MSPSPAGRCTRAPRRCTVLVQYFFLASWVLPREYWRIEDVSASILQHVLQKFLQSYYSR